ncbi:MAG: TPM domain-containing protein [Verrucomicrobiales bacterium]|nr:TPM domain-containing protein [Verrucomicrobiales bacterium]
MKRNLCRALSTLFFFLVIEEPGAANEIENIPKPDERGFIVDLANLISPEDEDHIWTKADELLTDTATPIIIVTINRMSDHADLRNMRIENFAQILFDQWGIGHLELPGLEPEDSNKGVLLLVSKGDRKARIELGAGWGREMDWRCQEIMNRIIVPAFKAGDFSGGIVQGFDSLEDMVRNGVNYYGDGGNYNDEIVGYEREKTLNDYLFLAAIIVLVVFTVVSMARSGTNGAAWIFWSTVFGTIFFIIVILSFVGGGGGFSGGSYGGGSSGGGGASGSW